MEFTFTGAKWLTESLVLAGPYIKPSKRIEKLIPSGILGLKDYALTDGCHRRSKSPHLLDQTGDLEENGYPILEEVGAGTKACHKRQASRTTVISNPMDT